MKDRMLNNCIQHPVNRFSGDYFTTSNSACSSASESAPTHTSNGAASCTQVSALLLLAQAWAAAGDTGAALRTAERALQLQPQDARVQELTAALEWSAGQESRARERARRLREIDPANPVALHILSLGSY